MANPEHVAELTGLDRLTVGLYRLGLLACAVGMGMVAAALPYGMELTLLGVGLAVADLHLYDPRFRWFITAVGVAGLWVSAVADGPVLAAAGHGLALVAWCALALKERLCFRIPGMPVLVLALAVVPFAELLDPLLLRGTAGLAALFGLVLAGTKLRQPLHYDIGDKSQYG